MASQTVDSLLLQVQSDDTGLTQQTNREIAQIERLAGVVKQVASSLPTISIKTDTSSLASLERFIKEATDVSKLKAFNTSDSRREVAELVAAFGPLEQEVRRFDPSGVFTSIIRGAEAATRRLQETTEAAARLASTTATGGAPGGGGGPPNNPPVDQFSAFRREAAATNATVAELTATMALANKGNVDWQVGIARTEAQLSAENVELAESARRTAQWAEASRQTNLTPFARGIEQVRLTGIGMREELEKGGPAFEKHALGAHRAASALGVLAAESIGIRGPIGRLAESLLLLSGGFGVVAVVAGTVLALAKTFEFLGTAEREAEEERKKIVTGLLDAAKNADAEAVAQRNLAAAITETADARKHARIVGFFASLEPADAPLRGVANEAVRQASKGVADAATAEAQARANVGKVEITNLTQALSLHVASTAEQRRALQIVNDILSRQGSLLQTDQQRLEDAKQLNAIQAAIADQARIAAAGGRINQVAQDIKAEQQQRIGAVEQRLRQEEALTTASTLRGTDEQLAANRTLFARLADLKRQAAGSDVDAIKIQVANQEARLKPGISEDVRRDAEGNIASLRAQIDLRKQTLTTQLQAIDNEHALADAVTQGTAALARRMEQERIARAGGGNVILGGAPPVRPVGDFDPRGGFAGTGALPSALLPPILQGAQSGVVRDLTAQLEREQQAAERAARATAVLDTSIHSIAGAAAGLASVVAGILGIGQAAQAAVRDVVSLVGGLGDIKKANADITAARDAFKVAQDKGDVAGQAAAQNAEATAGAEKVAGVIGAVTAGLGLVGNILSIGAALDAEHNRIVTENSQRLAELSLQLDRSFQGAGGTQKAAGLTGDVASVVAQTLNADALGALRVQDAFEEALKATGLTLREFEQIIKDRTGLEVLDSRGHVLATTLEQANEAFKKVIQTITTPSTDPGATRARLETEDKLRIGGRSTDPQVAAVEREREVILQGVQLSDAEEARIRAINLETAKGRAEFLKWEQDLARRAVVGGVSDTELHDFHDVDELIQALGVGADAVNAFTDSIHAVTDQTSNIPRSFKQFNAASAAEIAGLGPNVPQLPETPRLRGTDVNIPLPPELRGTDGASLPAFVAALKESTLTLKAVKEKPATITGNVVNQTFPFVPGDIREFARLVAIAMKELGTADNSSSGIPGGW